MKQIFTTIESTDVCKICWKPIVISNQYGNNYCENNCGLENDYYFLLNQEILYGCTSHWLDKKWYRRIFGGKWRLIKLGKDTPYTGMFCVWTKIGLKSYSGYVEVLEEENYPITGVDSKWKLIKQFFKNIKIKKISKN